MMITFCLSTIVTAAVFAVFVADVACATGDCSRGNPTLVTLQNVSGQFEFPPVQDASTVIDHGVYYAINDFTGSVIAVNVDDLSVKWNKDLPQMYTTYVMGGAARLMVTPNHVIVSTRVVGAWSQYGWTAAFTKKDFVLVWNVSDLACIGDLPTYLYTAENNRLAFFGTNYSQPNQYVQVLAVLQMSDGAVVKSITVGGGKVTFLPERQQAVVYVGNFYVAKYVELLDLLTLAPLWRVSSLSTSQFTGFVGLLAASSTYVVVANSTSTDATTANLLILSAVDGSQMHVIDDIPNGYQSYLTMDVSSSPSTALLSYFVGAFQYFSGFRKSTWTKAWNTSVNVSGTASVVPFAGDTLAILSSEPHPSLMIRNFTSGFEKTITNLTLDAMSSWPQLWVYTTNVIMVPFQTNSPWSAGFVLFNATNGASMGSMNLPEITYDTLWSQTPTFALQYGENQFLIDNSATLYRQTFV